MSPPPTNPQPSDRRSAQLSTQPSTQRPAEDRPVEDRPAEDRPAEDRPAEDRPVDVALRDIGDVPAVEVVTTVALHLMSAAAVKLGLGTDEATRPRQDLAEARTLITALAGLVTAAAPSLGTFHAAPLRDGLQALQRAFREESLVPDALGDGPGEQLTGPVR